MRKQESKTRTDNIGMILFIGSVMFVFGGLIGIATEEPEIVYQEKEQPMLMLELSQWGENEYDSSERLFDYYIYNFGSIEAKNVKVRCEINNYYGNLIQEETFSIGNIASNSYEFQESTIKFKGIASDYNEGMCYIESADGEYINLYDRLSENE